MGSTNFDGQVAVDTEHGTVSVTCARDLYPLDAIYGAAYVFMDRCYVFLDVPDPGQVRVRLKARQALTAEAAEALAGDLANELLAQSWRASILEKNRPMLETIVTAALGGASGAAGVDDLGDLDDLEAFDDSVFDDPLGIATSWEDKYGKKKDGDEAAAGDPAKDPAKEKDEP